MESNTEATAYRARLRVRIAKGLTTKKSCLTFVLDDRDVLISSADGALSSAKWLVLQAGGFASMEEATHFGRRLRSTLQLASLSLLFGVDTGNDTPTSWIKEDFGREIGLLEPHETTLPNVHGLMVVPDVDTIRFPDGNVTLSVSTDPSTFLGALNDASLSRYPLIHAAECGLRQLNLALMASSPLAKMVIAFSVVEELGQDEEWSDGQKQLITRLAADAANNSDLDSMEAGEVSEAIRKGLFRISLRQGVKRLLSRLDLDCLWKEWDRLYGIRSDIFHGTNRLPENELGQAAHDTIRLCGRIVLALAAKEGARIPSIAETRFV